MLRNALSAPGCEIVINRAPRRFSAAKLTDSPQVEKNFMEYHRLSKYAAHENVYVAIRDAFNAAWRKLQDHMRRQSGAIKVHDVIARAEV